MAWTVIARLMRADGSTVTRYARTFDTQLAALTHLAMIEVSWADPRVEIVLEEGGPFKYVVAPCLICGADLETHGKAAICDDCARWAVAVQNVANRRRACRGGWYAVEIAVQQERRARL